MNVIVIGDFLKDLDDEHTLCAAAQLYRQGVISLRCVIGNLSPADLRARGAKGTLKQLGLPSIPVGVGMAVYEGDTYPYETEVPYLAESHEVLPDGHQLLVNTLEGCPDKSVTLVLQSGLTDAAQLLRSHEGLCIDKLTQVAIMGGVELDETGSVKLDEAGLMIPNNANNNTFDMESANWLYRQLQVLGIPMVITTRDAAYSAQVPFSMYDALEDTGNPVGACLRGRQMPSLQKLWQAACSPSGSDIRGTLPNDRNRGWFINVFCNGDDPGIEDGSDIWPYVGSFNLYDPISFIAAIPALRSSFFNPHVVKVGQTTHIVIGMSRDDHNIKDVDALRQFMMNIEVEALKAAIS
jgi:hypothetical protein